MDLYFQAGCWILLYVVVGVRCEEILVQGGCSTELPKEQVVSMCQPGKTGPYQRIYLDTAREASGFDISHVPLCKCRLFLTNVYNLSIEVNGTSLSCGVLLMFKSGSNGSTTTSPICPRNFTSQSLTADGTTYFDVSLISIYVPITRLNYCVTLTPDDSYSRLQMVCGFREWPDVPIASSTTNPTEVESESLHPAWIAFIVASVVAIVGVAGVCLYFKWTHRGDDRRKLQNEE